RVESVPRARIRPSAGSSMGTLGRERKTPLPAIPRLPDSLPPSRKRSRRAQAAPDTRARCSAPSSELVPSLAPSLPARDSLLSTLFTLTLKGSLAAFQRLPFLLDLATDRTLVESSETNLPEFAPLLVQGEVHDEVGLLVVARVDVLHTVGVDEHAGGVSINVHDTRLPASRVGNDGDTRVINRGLFKRPLADSWRSRGSPRALLSKFAVPILSPDRLRELTSELRSLHPQLLRQRGKGCPFDPPLDVLSD